MKARFLIIFLVVTTLFANNAFSRTSSPYSIGLESSYYGHLYHNWNFGIGTNSPQNPIYIYNEYMGNPSNIFWLKGGYIFGREHTVQAQGGYSWVHYVLKSDYNLIPIPELEKNGIQLGEMDTILLKKIEEITLYIEQDKKLESQQKKIDELKNK